MGATGVTTRPYGMGWNTNTNKAQQMTHNAGSETRAVLWAQSSGRREDRFPWQLARSAFVYTSASRRIRGYDKNKVEAMLKEVEWLYTQLGKGENISHVALAIRPCQLGSFAWSLPADVGKEVISSGVCGVCDALSRCGLPSSDEVDVAPRSFMCPLRGFCKQPQ
eukprot:522020-Amphidinium_carterae.3